MNLLVDVILKLKNVGIMNYATNTLPTKIAGK